MKYPQFIGIAGPMDSGKSTVGRFIASLLSEELKVYMLPLADKVKQIAREIGWDGVKDERGRRLLQLIGTECGRNLVSKEVWLMHWRFALMDTAGWDMAVADDVRFPNEADYIISQGGIIIQMLRPTGRQVLCQECHTHESEVERLPDELVTAVIRNERGRSDLAMDVAELFDDIRRGLRNEELSRRGVHKHLKTALVRWQG